MKIPNPKFKTAKWAFFLTILLTAVSFAQEESRPFIGEITANDVNIRAGANMNFEVLAQVDKGELVFCEEKAYGWCKIELPQAASCFVSKEFIERTDGIGISTADNLNLRGQASLTSSVIGQLEIYEPVVILEELKDCYRIMPPQQCSGWVNSKFIKFYSPADDYLAKAKNRIDVRAEFLALQKKYASIDKKQPLTQSRLKELLKEFEMLINNNTQEPYHSAANRAIALIETQIAMYPISDLQTEKTAVSLGSSQISQLDSPFASGEIKAVYFLFKKPPYRYKLTKDKRFVCYLKSSTCNLDEYRNQEVFIWGSVTVTDDKKTLVDIVKIKPLE